MSKARTSDLVLLRNRFLGTAQVRLSIAHQVVSVPKRLSDLSILTKARYTFAMGYTVRHLYINVFTFLLCSGFISCSHITSKESENRNVAQSAQNLPTLNPTAQATVLVTNSTQGTVGSNFIGF